MPYSLAHNDGSFVAQIGDRDAVVRVHSRRLRLLYQESARHPRMMSVGMHMRLIGNPSRAVAARAMLLDYIMTHKDVWIARRVDIANHWRKVHPQ